MSDKTENGRERLERLKTEVLERFNDQSMTKTDLCHIYSVDAKTLHRFIDAMLGDGAYLSRRGPKRSVVAPKHKTVKRPNRYLDAAGKPDVAHRRQLVMQHWPAVTLNQY